MSDLIDRQSAIDAIIEDKICDDSLKIMTALGDGDKAETLNMTCDRHAKMLMSLPSAEPEIIYCKDCKHYDGRPCGIVDWYNTADDFCSRSERRTDE